MNGKEEHTRLMGKALMILMSMMVVMAAMMLAHEGGHYIKYSPPPNRQTHAHAHAHAMCELGIVG